MEVGGGELTAAWHAAAPAHKAAATEAWPAAAAEAAWAPAMADDLQSVLDERACGEIHIVEHILRYV